MAARVKKPKSVASALQRALDGQPAWVGRALQTSKRRALQTMLDNNPIVRQKLVERIERAIRREDIPVAVLHQVAQCIEMWSV